MYSFVFSLLLFNIYIKLLRYQYADDIQLYISIHVEVSDTANVLTQCLEAIQIWMKNKRVGLTLARLSGFGFWEHFNLGIYHAQYESPSGLMNAVQKVGGSYG